MERDRALEIKVGIFVGIFLALFVGVMIMLGSEENLFEENYVLHTSFADISGLRDGAAVRLAGMDVGIVTSIEFSQDPNDKKLEVHMRVASRFAQRIRKDTVAEIKTQGVLGDKYIGLSVGSMDEPELAYDSWVTSIEPQDLMDGVPEIKENVLSITQRLDKALAGEEEGGAGQSLAEIVDSVRDILNEIEEGRGLIHTLVYDDQASRRLRSTLASIDKVAGDVAVLTAEVKEGDGTLHALIYEDQLSELVATLEQTAADIDAVIIEIKEGDGTLHSLIYTEEGQNLIANLTEASADIKEMTAAVKAGDGTLGALIADPTVYEDVKTLLGGAKRNKILRSYVRETIRKNERNEGLSEGGAVSE